MQTQFGTALGVMNKQGERLEKGTIPPWILSSDESDSSRDEEDWEVIRKWSNLI